MQLHLRRGVALSRLRGSLVLVAASLAAGLSALWQQWPVWAAGLLGLPFYVVAWVVATTIPVKEPPSSYAPDLRLVRRKSR